MKGDHYEGLNSAYFDLIDRFLAPSSNIDLGAVNLVAERCLSPTTDIDCREIARLLGLLGLRINTRFVHNMAYEDLSKVTEAGLNLPAVHNQSIAVCEYLYKELNMPFVREGFPSGFKDTRIWLQSIKETLSLSTDIDGLMDAERTFFMNELDRLGNPLKDLKVVVNTLPIHIGWLIEFLELSGADLLEVNILDSAYFQKEFMDALDTLPCAVNQHMSFEDILANNRRSGADVLLQCSALHSSIPHHQPGLLIKEVPVVPPVGPRGLLNLFVNWSQWMRSTEVEGWRNEQLV